jgi:uncharacterized protein
MKATFPLAACILLLTACRAEQPAEAPSSDTVAASATSAPVASETPAPVPPPTGPVKPSFDCAKASGEIELLICSNYSLAAFDNRLAEIYAAELAKPGASKELTATQRGWLKGRDECWKAQDKLQCVTEEYMSRIAYLQINSPGQMAATAVAFDCNDNSAPFYMAFYGDLDNKPAVITVGNDQATIFPLPSGSGSKYGRNGIEFWEHQGKASVDFYGKKLECTAMPGSANP